MPSLDDIAAGAPLDGLPPATLAALFERAGIATARLQAHLLATRPAEDKLDRLIGIDGDDKDKDAAVRMGAAKILGMTKDHVYRHWKKLGGFKDSAGHIKFSVAALQRYIRRQAGG